MKLIDTLINIIFIVIILVVIYLLYKFFKDPVSAASKTVDARFREGEKDRLLFGFINLDEGFAGSKTLLNKISGGRLFPTVEQQQEERARTFEANRPPTNDKILRIEINEDANDLRRRGAY